MFHYYDKFKNQGTNNNNNYYVQQDNKKSVLDFFHKQSKTTPKQKQIPKQNSKKHYTKSEIINSYLMKVDDNFITTVTRVDDLWLQEQRLTPTLPDLRFFIQSA